jgi:anhydro-N-acetylmuramic acid kinase
MALAGDRVPAAERPLAEEAAAMPARDLFIGLMSGTSLDGVDAVLADFSGLRPALLAHAHHDFASELRVELLRLSAPGENELHRASVAAQHLARSYASAVEDLLLHAELEAGEVRAIGVHGQTVRHRPDAGYTLQLNAPATLAELTDIDVIADFRARDVAAGGQGAPLVPGFHASAFASTHARAVVNIGGIANVTGLPAGGAGSVIGFDCGPGNVLLDGWAQEHLGEPLDRDGHWAAGGKVSESLLAVLLEDPYLALAPPKSTGRETFNLDWLRQRLSGQTVAGHLILPQDVQATLTRFTARTIGDAVARYCAESADVVVCGGGAFNRTLMAMIAEECGGRPVRSSADLGIAPDHVEALAFAWLAYAHVHRLHGNLPSVTGARGVRILGALYPK